MKFFGRKEEDFVYRGCSANWIEAEEKYHIYNLYILIGEAATKVEAKRKIDQYLSGDAA